MFNNIFKNKKVLITGHTGFKGSWLSLWLKKLGADVYGFSNRIPTNPSMYELLNLSDDLHSFTGDIRDIEALSEKVNTIKPEFIFHMAAQALVPVAYQNPVTTFETNTLGTVNVLEVVRKIKHQCTTIIITSDKVYDNVEWEWGYRENDKIGGIDPYSASKGMAELAIRSYFQSYLKNMKNIKLGITRAGNVIGGGDWAEGRIVPDLVRSVFNKQRAKIRNPNSTRPWQHVLEPISGYLQLAMSLNQEEVINGSEFNFGPSADNAFSVRSLVNEIQSQWDILNWEDVSTSEKIDEAGLLKLNCDKALLRLNWRPVLDFKETTKLTVDWYKALYEKDQNLKSLSLSQIDSYISLAQNKELIWTS